MKEEKTKQLKSIFQKLAEAKKIIRNKPLKRNATNEYSDYNYFAPELVESVVGEVCDELQMVCLCNLSADEFGLVQTLILRDLESEQEIVFELRTEKQAGMKATGPAQQMGATDTYSERYIKMKVFGIKENNLDPDAANNTNNEVNQLIEQVPQITTTKALTEFWQKHKGSGKAFEKAVADHGKYLRKLEAEEAAENPDPETIHYD